MAPRADMAEAKTFKGLSRLTSLSSDIDIKSLSRQLANRAAYVEYEAARRRVLP